MATAKANSKLFPAAVNEIAVVWVVIPHPFTHKEADKEHHHKVNRQWNRNT